MTKFSKMTISVLMASAMSLSAMPMANANDLKNFGKNMAKGAAYGAGAAVGIKIIDGVGNMIFAPKSAPAPQRQPVNQNVKRAVAPSPAAKQAKVTPPKPRQVADMAVMEAQQNLASLGFSEVGKPDGFAGKGTAAAVRAFQKSRNLPVTGVLDPTLMSIIASSASNVNTANPVAQAPAAITPVTTPLEMNIVAETNEMSQEEYIEAVRSEGAVFESDEIQKTPEPVKTPVDQPVGIAMAPGVTKSGLVDTSVVVENPVEADATSDVLKNDLFN